MDARIAAEQNRMQQDLQHSSTLGDSCPLLDIDEDIERPSMLWGEDPSSSCTESETDESRSHQTLIPVYLD